MELKNKIKDRPSVIAHLEFLQNIMNRMSSNCSSAKALTAVIYTIIITLFLTIKRLDCIWWVGIIFSFFGALFDSYYLGLERTFRKQYTTFLYKLDNETILEEEIYNIKNKNTGYKHERFCETLDAIVSPSIIMFYGILMLISILLYLI